MLGHLKIINFPFVPNGKLIIYRCPKIWTHYSLNIMWLNIGTPKKHYFPFGTNGKVVGFDVPVFKHFRVSIFLHKNIFRYPSLKPFCRDCSKEDHNKVFSMRNKNNYL